MRKICEYYTTTGAIWQQKTGIRFRNIIARSNLSQREICRRIGIHPDRLCRLLQGSPRYRWSEDIARRIMKALKKK